MLIRLFCSTKFPRAEIFYGPSTYSRQTPSNLTFVTGQRGMPKLIHRGYSFCRNKANNSTTYWRCSALRLTGCKARVVTNEQQGVCSSTSPQHNHDPDYEQFINVDIDAGSEK